MNSMFHRACLVFTISAVALLLANFLGEPKAAVSDLPIKMHSSDKGKVVTVRELEGMTVVAYEPFDRPVPIPLWAVCGDKLDVGDTIYVSNYLVPGTHEASLPIARKNERQNVEKEPE